MARDEVPTQRCRRGAAPKLLPQMAKLGRYDAVIRRLSV